MDGDSSFIGLFTAPLSSVLVSHFLLDLQEAYQRKVVGLGTDDPLHTSQSFSLRSMNFTPALGSLGATIDPAHYGREDEDEDIDARLGVPEDVPGYGGGSSRDARIEDEFAIMEVPRPGGTELAIGL
ncbi:hypothetical protein LXA43DRAFT_220188 [Ganoderma leucocontextum]|nr:hypothetical protein LXA43DRAFT_220188 [Ganoderma leucocontextum]